MAVNAQKIQSRHTPLTWREGRFWQARTWARCWVESDEKDQRGDPESQPSSAPCSSSLGNQVWFIKRAVHVGCSHGGCTSPQLHHWTHVAGDSPSGRQGLRCALRQPQQAHDIFAEQQSAVNAGLAQPSPQCVFFLTCSSYLLRKGVSWSRVECPITQIWALPIVQSFGWSSFKAPLTDEIIHCIKDCFQHSETNKASIKHQSINVMGACISTRLTKVLTKCIQLALYVISIF